MMIPCPACRGVGSFLGGALLCDVCQGRREIGAEHLTAWERGQALKAERLARRENMRTCAARMGISPVDLANRERGVTPA